MPRLPRIDYVHLNPGRAGLVNGGERGLREYRWSSLAQGYVLHPVRCPPWLVAQAGLCALETPDSASGRRRLVERLNAWIREKRFGGPLDGVGIAERIRRGWFWGTERFREKLRKRLQRQGKMREATYRGSATMRDYQERCGQRILKAAKNASGSRPRN